MKILLSFLSFFIFHQTIISGKSQSNDQSNQDKPARIKPVKPPASILAFPSVKDGVTKAMQSVETVDPSTQDPVKIAKNIDTLETAYYSLDKLIDKHVKSGATQGNSGDKFLSGPAKTLIEANQAVVKMELINQKSKGNAPSYEDPTKTNEQFKQEELTRWNSFRDKKPNLEESVAKKQFQDQWSNFNQARRKKISIDGVNINDMNLNQYQEVVTQKAAKEKAAQEEIESAQKLSTQKGYTNYQFDRIWDEYQNILTPKKGNNSAKLDPKLAEIKTFEDFLTYKDNERNKEKAAQEEAKKIELEKKEKEQREADRKKFEEADKRARNAERSERVTQEIEDRNAKKAAEELDARKWQASKYLYDHPEYQGYNPRNYY